MYLRKLEEKDIPLMLEWMHDITVVDNMGADFMSMDRDSCENFIIKANKADGEIHRAICLEDDVYQGTISLKNIDFKNRNAEYAIVIRTSAMGRGISAFATSKILDIAFKELMLHKVYLYVKRSNVRALRFYEKMGFSCEGEFRDHIRVSEKSYENLVWLSMLAGDYDQSF